MSKMSSKTAKKTVSRTENGLGQIKHNHLVSLVTSKVYQQKVEKAKKGKGSYCRKNMNKTDAFKGQEPYVMAA